MEQYEDQWVVGVWYKEGGHEQEEEFGTLSFPDAMPDRIDIGDFVYDKRLVDKEENLPDEVTEKMITAKKVSAKAMKKKPNDCCNIASNLYRLTDQERPDLKIEKCRVCGCRHFDLKVDPGNMRAVMTGGK